MSSSQSVIDYLDAQKLSFPDLAPIFDELSQLYQKKLWHQLTEKLLSAISHPHFHSDSRLISLYDHFLSKISKKINAFYFAQLSITISRQYDTFNEANNFLSGLLSSEGGGIINNQSSVLKNIIDEGELLQASIIIKCELIKLKLRYSIDIDQQQKILIDIKKSMDNYNGILSEQIHSAYYHTAMAIDRSKGAKALGEFYQHSILFLTYNNDNNTTTTNNNNNAFNFSTEQEKLSLAVEICQAALLGKNIYNFGELLQNPLFSLLEKSSNTQHQQLSLLLKTFNNGNINEFLSLYPTTIKNNNNFPLLSPPESESFLQEKIRLMALIELCFQRPINDRTLAFSEISTICVLDINKVELLLMKALAYKIIKGSIDQISSVVRVTWVQPRVLHIDQIKNIKNKLIQWNKEVQNTASFLDDNATEILHHHNQ